MPSPVTSFQLPVVRGSSIRGRLTGNWQLGTGNDSRQSRCTLHVLCGRKNYRLQDIQLSKNVRLKLPAASFRCQLLERRVRGELLSLYSLLRFLQLKAGSWKLEADMENTGLEPVTSWLQTRRSPS